MKTISLIFLAVLFWNPVAIADTRTPITITYYPYPPDIRIEDGKPVGKYIDRMNQIIEMANMRAVWLASNFADEADILNNANRDICTTGRIRTEERAKLWAFLPYIFDHAPGDIVLSRPADHEKLKRHGNIASLVQDRSLIGVFLESGIYGDPVDAYLAKQPEWILRSGKTDFQLIHLVETGRAHYTVVPANQWDEARRLHPKMFHLQTIPDYGTHPPYPIAIACSRSVKPETLNALSAAMKALDYQPWPTP